MLGRSAGEAVVTATRSSSSAHRSSSVPAPIATADEMSTMWTWDAQAGLLRAAGNQSDCLTVTPDVFNMTIAQAMTIVDVGGQPVQFESVAAGSNSVDVTVPVKDGAQYTLLLSAATTLDTGGADPIPASVAILEQALPLAPGGGEAANGGEAAEGGERQNSQTQPRLGVKGAEGVAAAQGSAVSKHLRRGIQGEVEKCQKDFEHV